MQSYRTLDTIYESLENVAGDIDMKSNAIVNLRETPQNNRDAASKKYVDTEDAKLLDLEANRQMKGDLDMGNNTIVGIKNIVASNSVVSRSYITNNFLKKSGGTMTGNINLGNHRINNLPGPTHLLHPANKDYVDEEIKKILIPLIYNHTLGLANLPQNTWKYPSAPYNTQPYPWMNCSGLDESSYFELGVHTFDSDNPIPLVMTMEYKLEVYDASGLLHTWTFFSGNIKSYRVPLQNIFCINQKYFFKNFPFGNYKQFTVCRLGVNRKFSGTFGNESCITIAIAKAL